MSDTYMDLPTRMEDAFPEIDSDIVMDLRRTNEEYQEIAEEIASLTKANSFIGQLMDKSEEIHLTAKEHGIFRQYLQLVMEKENMERQHIYLRGQMDAVAYLKKIGAL